MAPGPALSPEERGGMAETLAGLAALLYAGSSVAVKRAVEDTSIQAGLLISLGVGSVATVALLAGSGSHRLDAPAVVGGFVIAGVLGPAIGRGTSMIGVRLLGPSRSVPIQAALYPLFASIFAVLFLEEVIDWRQGIGLLLVGCGVWLLSLPETNPLAKVRSELSVGRLRLPAVLFPLVAGLAFGFADLFRKRAIDLSGDALLGAAIGTFTALCFWSLVIGASRQKLNQFEWGRGVLWFALAGLLSAGAILALIAALDGGDVSVVSPIIAAEPLGVIVLSALFLRDIELVTKRVVLGATAVVMGTVVVGLFG